MSYLNSETFIIPTSAKGRCLTFWYFVSGQVSAGFLIVSLQNLKTNEVVNLWKDGGFDHGDQWIYGSLGFYMEDPYMIIFNAVRGGSPGIVGLDDISFKESHFCSVSPSNASTGNFLPLPPVRTTTKSPVTIKGDLDCDFETDLCKWKNVEDVMLSWKRNQGNTGTSMTGPMIDHT